MEKRRKEKVRSGRINSNNPSTLSSTTNPPRNQNNSQNFSKEISKKFLVQQIDNENNFKEGFRTSNHTKNTKSTNSLNNTNNLSKQNPKNSSIRNSKSDPNYTLSPTNILKRSRKNNKKFDFNEGSDIEENSRFKRDYNNLNQSSPLDFSPIQKKRIKMSPVPYDNDIEYDLEKDFQYEFDLSHKSDSIDEKENNRGNNSSFTQLFTSKCDLKAELQAAIQVNKQLKQRDQQLQKRIQDLNNQSQRALQVLEDRLTELKEENIRLIDYLESLPTEERLIIEYNQLTTFPIEDDEIEPLINIGILEEGENISVLKERLDGMIYELRYYESLYDIVAQYGEDGLLTKFFLSYFDDSYLNKNAPRQNDSSESKSENEEKLAKMLKHKIDLLETSDSSLKTARKKLAKLEKEVELLRRDVQDQRNYSNYQNSESSSALLNQSGIFSLQEIKNVLITAGGNKNNLSQINGNTFVYKKEKKREKPEEIKFSVEPICGRPYATPSGSKKKVSLFTFFKNII